MLRRIIVFALLQFFAGSLALAASRPFFQIATLRFGDERTLQVPEGVGEVDINDLSNQEYIHVQGSIPFIPGQFVEPRYLTSESFQELLRAQKAIPARLNLKSHPPPIEGTDATFGTFIMRFRNSNLRDISLNVPRFYHPVEAYVVHEDGTTQRLFKVSELNQDPTKNRNFNTNIVPQGMMSIKGDFVLYAHVSGPLRDGKNTLNFAAFFIGESYYLSNITYKTRYYSKAISGAFLIVFLFYFFIYMFRREDKSSLYLSSYALFSWGMSLIYTINSPLTPNQTLDVFTTLNLLGVCSLQFYLFDKLAFLMTQKRRYTFMALSLSVSLFAILFIYLRVPALVGIFFLISFLSSTSLIFATLYLGLKHKLNGIVFFLIGTVFNLTFQFPIMMSYILRQNTENGYYIMLANFSMAIAIALVNAKEFAVTYKKSVQQGLDLEEKNKEITFFNKNLEKLVDNKTKEIRSLLDYIPQGVLSIGSDGIVAKDFSAHLVEILNDPNIAQRSFKELVLDRCSNSNDEKDQAWQSIMASVGESELNYLVNADKLPSELCYHTPKGTKYLKATWNIDVEDDQVQRILVTLLDISSEKELELQAEAQRRELELLLELLAVPANKIAQFFTTSLPLLEENQRLIDRAQSGLDESVLRMLFVNAHTVKGAARTLQLKELSRSIHDAEEHYADVLKGRNTADIERMKRDIAQAIAVFHNYVHINRNKLNRSDDYSKVAIERGFIEQHYHLLKLLGSADALDTAQIIQSLKEQSDTLTQLIFELLPGIMDGYRDRAQKIAKDLNKPEPKFELHVDPIPLSPDKRATLDHCMVHMLRNALDHGIEPPEERRKKQKPDQGKIQISAVQRGRYLHMELSDDGRGLAIGRLREKAAGQGTLPPNPSLQDIAEIIFQSGVSTAQGVTAISGRGVGMDAVRTFLEKAGGSINIVLGEPKDPEQQFFAFHFVIELPLEEDAVAA